MLEIYLLTLLCIRYLGMKLKKPYIKEAIDSASTAIVSLIRDKCLELLSCAGLGRNKAPDIIVVVVVGIVVDVGVEGTRIRQVIPVATTDIGNIAGVVVDVKIQKSLRRISTELPWFCNFNAQLQVNLRSRLMEEEII